MCKGVVMLGGLRVEPRGLHITFKQPNSQNRGATWQPLIGPRGTLPFAKKMPRVATLFGHQQQIRICHITCQCHDSMYGCLRHHCTVLPRGSTACPVSIIFFTCFARRTDLDNFSIRTPFAKVNIPPESGERDRRNGTVFVAFRAI